MGSSPTIPLANLYASLLQTPRIFVSYHHGGDQYWYNRFSTVFHDAYDLITDRSLEEPFDSTNTSYLRQAVRERHITGTSATVVLCGVESWKRKWIDWETQMTLNKNHGLLGVVLPTHPFGSPALVPDRLHDNILTGYAHWIHWTEDGPTFRHALEEARQRSSQTKLINNSRTAMNRNLP
jgi:hypothetical protein